MSRVSESIFEFPKFINFNNDTSNIYDGCQFLNFTRSQKALRWGWEGIPFNVIFNSVLFLNLICLFGWFRRMAWKKRDVPHNYRHWLHFIYGDREQALRNFKLPELTVAESDTHEHDKKYQQLFKFMKDNENSLRVGGRLSDELPAFAPKVCKSKEHNNNEKDLNKDTEDETLFIKKQPTTEEQIHEDQSFQNTNLYTSELGHWMLTLLLIKDSDILKKKGPDAVHYLIFQKYLLEYLLFFLLILTVVCLFVILPVNLTGEVESRPFAQTTISNIPPNSSRLWVHVICSLIMLSISLWMMCHFSRIINADQSDYIKRTLLIENVPKRKRTSQALLQYFERLFPNISIEGIQFVYDTRKLKYLHTEYVSAIRAKNYCARYLEQNNKHLYLRNCCCIQPCCSCCMRRDALEFYTNEKIRLEDQLVKEFYFTIGKPLGSVFVTFQTSQMALSVFQHFTELREQSWSTMCLLRCLRVFSKRFTPYDVERNNSFKLDRWEVTQAPLPDEINWNDIGILFKWVWVRKVIIYLILLIIFIFITTPLMFVGMMDYLKMDAVITESLNYISPMFKDYYTPLLFILFSLALPAFVQISCDYLPYKTMTDKNNSIMTVVFYFLLLMVIILPSLGLTSTQALLMNAIANSTHTFQCLFPVDNGAFFVNYVLQSTFLTNAMELLRFSELFLYFLYYVLFTKSEAEFEKIRKMIYFDFQFGIRYPRFLLIFCMVVTYSLTCPVIAPCGLFYMTIKHFVDRYNIYYVYNPSKISGKIHSNAITFFQVAIVMMLTQMATFIGLKTGPSYMLTVSLFILFACLVLFIGQCIFGCCWTIGETLPAKRKSTAPKKDFCSCSYLPPVLFDINLDDKMMRIEKNAIRKLRYPFRSISVQLKMYQNELKSLKVGCKQTGSDFKIGYRAQFQLLNTKPVFVNTNDLVDSSDEENKRIVFVDFSKKGF